MRESSLGTNRPIEGEVQLLRAAARNLEKHGFKAAELGIVLGSGLKDFADRMTDRIEIPFNKLAEFPNVRVPGHGGKLIQGRIGDVSLHCLTGRIHLYEGYHPWEVVRAVRALAILGTRLFVLTNAAGGIREDLIPGSLMLIVDHLDLTATSPLVGAHNAALGPRFPALNDLYCPVARKILRAADPGDGVREGVYAQMPGPSYETSAEVRMIRTLGGDAVGMSTVPEAVALHAMGCRVAGLSVITNRAAGLAAIAPSHKEVLEETERTADRLFELLASACPELSHLAQAEARSSATGRQGGPAVTQGSRRRS